MEELEISQIHEGKKKGQSTNSGGVIMPHMRNSKKTTTRYIMVQLMKIKEKT